jgi:asparagine synthase (glutamine-hydrolysing)
MCGVWALVGKLYDPEVVKFFLSSLQKRGPEGATVKTGSNYQLGFTRLALNGLGQSGMQPMKWQNTGWICNGEIYNWKELANEIHYENISGSDCEIIGPLFNKVSLPTFFQKLHGVFAMVIVQDDQIVIGRDPFGVRPLFLSQTRDRIVVSSELKGISNTDPVIVFPPGHYATICRQTLALTFFKYYSLPTSYMPADSNIFLGLQAKLIQSVKRRMLSERPIAALLSGGLDSSLIAALVQRELKNQNKPPLETFSIGFVGSEDLRNARIVANYIESNHTEIVLTPDDFFKAINPVISDIGSFDITTVRASVGNWLVAKEISKRSKCKVVFNGDGADEVLGGYLYFHRSPSNEEFELETTRLLSDIHLFDVLRSDRCISSHGLEPRTPFLDKEFVEFAKSIPIEMRRPSPTQIEKWVLRKAFEDLNILPREILYRKKEAFSDGVSSSEGLCWYQECQQRSEKLVPNWKKESLRVHYLPPQTAEAYYYRVLFYAYYPNMERTIPYMWMPKWSPETTDPSARTLQPTTVNTC